MSKETIINVSIDVTKLDKARFVVGQKGTYANLVLIPTPENKYGDDFLVKQNKRADDPAVMPILGNAAYAKVKQDNVPF